MDKKFWSILAVIAVIFVGIFWLTSNKKSSPTSSNSQPTNHVEGSSPLGIKLVEYGDYECPYCSQYYPIVKQIAADYSTQIVFQFRHLPLTQLHPNAFAGARAAEAAAVQNKFWEMHDTIYANQDPTGKAGWVASSDPLNEYFINFASHLGLNITQFKQDYASDKVNNLINADVNAFSKTGAQEATPAFFLDGKHISPTESVDSFKKLIDAEILIKVKASGASSNPSNSKL